MIFQRLNQAIERLLARGTLSSSSGVHLNAMDGLRGLAIIMVVCSHAFYVNPSGPELYAKIAKLIGAGWMGVPVFFVLSGFLISYPFLQARVKDPRFWYPRGYAARRALKIFPPFLLTTLVLVFYYYARFHDSTYFTVGFQWATGLAHYVRPARDFNSSFWSLWVEIHFYLVLPLLFLLFRNASLRGTYWGMFFIFALVPPIARLLTWPTGGDQHEIIFMMRRFPNALDNFAWGVLLAGIYVTRDRSHESTKKLARWGYPGTLLLAVGAVVLAYAPFSPRMIVEWQRLLPGVAAFLMGFFIFDPSLGGSRFFSTPILRFVGMISFEWFLIHQPMLAGFRILVGSTQGKMPLYLFTVITPCVVSFVVAVLIYYWFSLPIMSWGRKRLAASGKPKPVTQTAVPPGVGTRSN